MDAISLFNELAQVFEEQSKDTGLEYLKRGEKLITLLRTKKMKEEFKQDDFLELFAYNQIDRLIDEKKSYDAFTYVLKRISTLFRTAAREAAGGHFEKLRELFSYMPQISITDEDEDRGGTGLARAIFTDAAKDKLERMVGLKVANLMPSQDGTWHMPLPDVTAPTKVLRPYWYKNDPSTKSCLVSCEHSFSKLYLMMQIKKIADEKITDEERQNTTGENCSELYGMIAQGIIDEIAKYMNYGMFYCLPKVADIPCVMRWSEAWNVSIVRETAEKSGLNVYRQTDGRLIFYIWMLFGKPEEAPICIEVFSRSERYLSVGFSAYYSTLLKLFMVCTQDYRSKRAEMEFIRHINSVAKARPYESLKNVPDKYLMAMQGSRFNELFGFCEFDPDIMLVNGDAAYLESESDQTYNVAPEAIALANTFHWRKRDDVTLRFRKLGNYRVAGMYWPALKCICVDVRYSGSFFHEYMHMLDHENQMLSGKVEFSQIRQKYSYLIRSAVAKDKKLKEQLKGKFDLDYYLMGTEIFARTGEIYASKLCGISNSLVDHLSADNFAYPNDDELNELIRTYFDNFFEVDSNELAERLADSEAQMCG